MVALPHHPNPQESSLVQAASPGFNIRDDISGRTLLVDTGAHASVFPAGPPPTQIDHLEPIANRL